MGFTLVEVLLSLVLVSIGMLATMSLLMFIRQSNVMEQERSRARQIVYEQLEAARASLYTHLASGTTVTVWDNGTPNNPADDTQGALDVIVKNLAGTRLYAAPVPAQVVQVEVTLSWHPHGRRAAKVMRETVMSYFAP
jgi:prepilin-type N-terminal cleavage/methylation domain-containing protein